MALLGFFVVFVVTVNVRDVAPSATITLAGTVASDVFELDRVTVAPPAGAAAVSVTVPVDDAPPTTEVGLSVSVERFTTGGGGGGGTGFSVSTVCFVTPL